MLYDTIFDFAGWYGEHWAQALHLFRLNKHYFKATDYIWNGFLEIFCNQYSILGWYMSKIMCYPSGWFGSRNGEVAEIYLIWPKW